MRGIAAKREEQEFKLEFRIQEGIAVQWIGMQMTICGTGCWFVGWLQRSRRSCLKSDGVK
jgi:hypothetical protein